MTIKHQPATPLPWTDDPEGELAVSIEGTDGSVVCDVHGASDDPHGFANVSYIMHAANAYPGMIQAVTQLAYSDMGAGVMRQKLRALLRELGETD